MRLVLGNALSFAGPILLGWLLMRRVWPAGPSRLCFSLGMPLGMGVVGAVYYLALLLTRSSWASFAVSEVLMVAAIAVGAVYDRAFFEAKVFTPPGKEGSPRRLKHITLRQSSARRGRSLDPGPTSPAAPITGGSVTLLDRRGSPLLARRGNRALSQFIQTFIDRAYSLAFLVTAGLAGLTLLFTAATAPSGQWDATAVWNLKARFIYEAPADPLSKITDPTLWDTQPDYPLLLPVLVARGWQYAGSNSAVVPIGIGILFTASTVLILVGGVRSATNATQSYVAGSLLLATPFFIRHGVSQYADVVISCYMTTSVVLLCISDAPLFLAGLAAGLAACTKNEGLLFGVIFIGAVAASRRSVREAGRTFAGAAAGVAVLGAFKYLYSPANPIVHAITRETVLQRLFAWNYHVHILKAFAERSRAFGDWWIAPFVLVVLHVVVAKRSGPTPWLAASLPLTGMLVGYYTVYLLSPYDLDWHIGTSMNRLLLQLWPMFLLTYSLLAAGPELPRVRDTLPRQVSMNG